MISLDYEKICAKYGHLTKSSISIHFKHIFQLRKTVENICKT